MADEVDPTVDSVEASSGRESVDGPAPEAEREELVARHDAVLPTREPGELPVGLSVRHRRRSR